MVQKKKKQPHNAFYFFMLDWKQREEAKGKRFPGGLKDVSQLCSEEWETLDKDRVEHYKKMERESKAKDKTDLSNKYTATGKSYQMVEAERREAEEAHDRMISYIETTVATISKSEPALKNHCFYLAHANVYCYWGEQRRWIPCEVAISKFNLAQGLIDTYHVYPGVCSADGCVGNKLPMGYCNEARLKREETHQMPEPQYVEEIELDYQKIANDINRFLMPKGGSEVPPVFTMEDDLNTNNNKTAVENFFENVFGLDDGERYRVYTLPYLFHLLYEACVIMAGGDERWPVSYAQQQLEKDIYNYTTGISCDFHAETDAYHYCSLSVVKRWVYLICEYCCRDLDIQFIPGGHCPLNAKVNTSRGGSEAATVTPKDEFQTVTSKSSKRAPPADEGSSGYMRNITQGMRGVNIHSKPAAPNAYGRGVTTCASGGFTMIDHTKVIDPEQQRVYKTGQSPNVVSEYMPQTSQSPREEQKGLRLPVSKGRGELLAALVRDQSAGPSFTQDDFPTMGAAHAPRRPGAAPPQSRPAGAWGRGFSANY